jgi:hypothetical protein
MQRDLDKAMQDSNTGGDVPPHVPPTVDSTWSA